MLNVLGIALNVISPIFIIMGASFVIGRRLQPDPRALSVFLIYLLVPMLTFKGIRESQLSPQELGGIAGMVIGMTAVMVVLGVVIARRAGWDNRLTGGFLISLIMVNAANYGIPVNTFAFGEEGGKVAIVYYALNTIVGNVLGIYFASGGSTNARQALWNVLTVPGVYAAFIGLAFNVGKVELPLPIERAVDIVANGAIPVMLILLGLQLAYTKTMTGKLRPVLVGVALRLVLAPLVALPMAWALGLTGVAFSVAVVQSSMPSAVFINALASEFGSDTDYTAMMTLVSTLFSVVTLSLLIAVLTGGQV
jgi:predicted permease